MELLEKIIIQQFIKINIGEQQYQDAIKNQPRKLNELFDNTEKLWDKGIRGNIV